MRSGVATVFLSGIMLSALPAFAQLLQQHPSSYGPSALEDHAARIESYAVEYLKTNSKGPHSVDIDVYASRDKKEFEALGKYIVLVFASFADNKAELPLSKVYSGRSPIKCLPSVWRNVPSKSATAKANGSFRSDTLCLLPIDMARRSDDIFVDFAKNYRAVKVVSYAFRDIDLLKSDRSSHSFPVPNPDVLKKIIDREYPGFGFRVQQ